MPEQSQESRSFPLGHIARSYLRCAGQTGWLIPVQTVLAVIDGIMQAAVPAALGYIVDGLVDDPQAFVANRLGPMAVLTGIGIVVFYGIAYAQHYLAQKIGNTVGVRFRMQLYRHLQTLSADFYQRRRVGDITARLTNDINVGVIPFYHRYISIVWALAVLIPSCIAMIYVDTVLLFLFLGMTGLLLLLSRVVMPKVRRLNRQVQDEAGRINARATEDITTASLTRAFVREREARCAMGQHNEHFLKKALRTAKVTHLYSDVINMFVNLGAPLGLLFIGALFVGEGITVGALVAAYGYWQRATSPVSMILNNITQFFVSFSSLDRVLEFFEEQPSVADRPNAAALRVTEGRVDMTDLVFSYPVSDMPRPVLRGFTLTIPPRQRVALIGESGAGKSTLVQLLLRLYDPQSGAIHIDGQDLRDVTQESLRLQIGLVMQETILLSGSVRDNLILAKNDANDEEIIAALRNAEAWDFVRELPEGLDTPLGERGARLSGGQRQRLSIARVFLKNPPVVVFDEATSALDTVTEQLIQNSMRRLFDGRTSIIIAHRLSTIVDCDRLVLLEKGRIVGQGTHEELRRTSERYSRMCEGQLLPS